MVIEGALTYEEVLERLLDAVGPRYGAAKAFAEAVGVSESMVSAALRGSKRPGAKILKHLGLRRVVVYVPLGNAFPSPVPLRPRVPAAGPEGPGGESNAPPPELGGTRDGMAGDDRG